MLKMIPLGEYSAVNSVPAGNKITDVFKLGNFREQEKIANSIMTDINTVAGVLFQLWKRNA